MIAQIPVNGIKKKQQNNTRLCYMKKRKKYTKEYYARKYGYKSGLEVETAEFLKENNIEVKYETLKITYMIPERKTYYKPDFNLPNGIIVETKGRFTAADRNKHLLIKEQYPELDIRFVFSNPNSKLRKGSNSTYATWCEKYGFKYAKAQIPMEWLNE